jgi:uncharacterized protein
MIRRESPWGPLEVADAHLHFFSHTFFDKLIAQKPGLTREAAMTHLGWVEPPVEPEELAEVWARELDRNGVAAAALIASLPGEEESVIRAARVHPSRFVPFAMVNPRQWKPEKAEGIRAVCLFPAMHLYSVQDDVVRPVFEWAAANHRAVFVHCGVLSVGVRGKLGLASAFDLRYSNPIDLHPVALRYPTVPIIVPHLGAGYFREALMLADMCPNVYLDTSSSNQWMRYQAAHLDLREVFRHALAVVGSRRLVFGTDSSYFPRGWHHAIFDDQAKALYEINLSAEDAGLIFGQNLLRIVRG